jgi:hypothetical protein
MSVRMMLLAGVAGIALASPARAQWIVNDPINTLVAQTAWVKQAADMIRQIEEMQRQYRMLSSTYNAISHATDISGVASALGGVTRTYLPEASGALSLVGQGSRLLSGAGRIRSADTLFMPQAASGIRSLDRWRDEMERRQNVTANAKALAEAGMIDMEQRIAGLGGLQAEINRSRDGTQSAAYTNAIAASRTNLEAHNASVANLRLALAAADRTDREREEQIAVQGASNWMDDTAWAVESLGR